MKIIIYFVLGLVMTDTVNAASVSYRFVGGSSQPNIDFTLEVDFSREHREGRFKSQALLDEAAVLTCMMYVDLNPIRAGVCETPEHSGYISIQERLMNVATSCRKAAPRQSKSAAKKTNGVSAKLSTEYPPAVFLHFTGDAKANNEANTGIPFGYSDYLTLLDWTGRAVRDD